MTILSVKEIWRGRVGTIDDKFRRRYTRTFRVITDHAHIGPGPVRQATGIPSIGDPYVDQAGNFDLGVVCNEVEARQQEEDPFTWIVTATFDAQTSDPDREASPANPSPLDKPAQIVWSYDSYQRVLATDLEGRPVMNSAGEEFDPAVDIEDCWPKLTITRNEATFDPALAFSYRNAINSDPWMGGAPKTWKARPPTGTIQYENGLAFWSVTYEFHYKSQKIKGLVATVTSKVVDGEIETIYRDVSLPEVELGWDLLKLDKGHRQLVGDPKKLKELTDDFSGQPLTRPALLDGSGARLVSGGDPYYIRFSAYPLKSFAALGLP